MDNLNKVLNQDEKVLWQGQPQWLPYMVSTLPVIIFGLIWLGIVYAIFSQGGQVSVAAVPIWIFLLFILPAFFMLISPIFAALMYKNVWYAITDKRVVFQKGLIGINFDSVDYDKIESADMNVGIIDKMFGKNSGNILIYANRIQSQGDHRVANVPLALAHITDPYNIFELFKKSSFDVKTDINYPNALRPNTNPGYPSSYDPNQK